MLPPLKGVALQVVPRAGLLLALPAAVPHHTALLTRAKDSFSVGGEGGECLKGRGKRGEG